MAKDGTLRGTTSTGRKKKSIVEKLENGNPGHRRLEVMDAPDAPDSVDLVGIDMPPVEEYMQASQRDGKTFKAKEIYEKTYIWLKSLRMEKTVNIQLVNQYAMSVGRWIQCEEAISQFGMLAKHPTTGAAIQSPYVAMSQSFMKQANIAWMQIYQIVKENCTVDFRGPNPHEDAMELLLKAREKK